MNIKFGYTQARKEAVEAVLPDKPFTTSILEPEIEKHLYGVIAHCIRAELEVYRRYPKQPNFGSEPEPPEEAEKTFDPRNNTTCFMGKGFKANADATDFELAQYRKAVGTIPHPVWGDCTLLEIWGGDHFEEHNEMVVGAFRYGMRMTDECPEIKVHVNPLFQNAKTKDQKLTAEQREEKEYREELFAKALVFGVKTPEEARRARKR